MSNLTDTLLSQYRPKVALMVYEACNDQGRDSKYYLESHDISEDGQIMAGKPLLQETIQDIVEVFSDENREKATPHGTTPDNLLYFRMLSTDDFKLIWYRPEEERVLHHAPQLRMKTDKALIPALVYMCTKSNLLVYALKTNKRPQEKTPLFKAPFFNTNDTGGVCLGNAKTKKPTDPTFENIMKYWEDLYWLSEFTHVNGSEKVKSGDLKKLWVTLLGKNLKFPTSELLQLKITIKSLI